MKSLVLATTLALLGMTVLTGCASRTHLEYEGAFRYGMEKSE